MDRACGGAKFYLCDAALLRSDILAFIEQKM